MHSSFDIDLSMWINRSNAGNQRCLWAKIMAFCSSFINANYHELQRKQAMSAAVNTIKSMNTFYIGPNYKRKTSPLGLKSNCM